MRRSVFMALLAVAVLVGTILPEARVASSEVADTIDLGQFRWSSFPLKVFVGMNLWTASDHPSAVREALDAWVASIWEYISTYNDSTLSDVNYYFYVDGTNSSGSYDVEVFFNQNQVASGNAVGLTTTRWNAFTHEPIAPIVINVTTYSGTASKLFVKDVVMHEFGHALGLNHASSPDTSDGPELMYATTHTGQVVYPSTLDVYALSVLYRGSLGATVQLPNNIPYKMLVDGNAPPPPLNDLWDALRRYMLIIALALILIVAVLVVARDKMKKEKTDEASSEREPPAPPSWPTAWVRNHFDASYVFRCGPA